MAATDKQLHIKGLGEEISALYNLPWHTPLEQWPEDETLAAQRGISRHIVRLVRSTPDPASEIYAVKETVEEFAVREYEALRELSLRGAPAVAQVAIVTNRYSQNGEELPCAIVTRFLPYSLPYRVILSGQITQHEITNMANAPMECARAGYIGLRFPRQVPLYVVVYLSLPLLHSFRL